MDVTVPHAAVRYREYLPCEALRSSVGALFSFCEPDGERTDRCIFLELTFNSGERDCAPTFADGCACIVFNFGEAYWPEGVWRPSAIDTAAVLVGPLTAGGPAQAPARQKSMGVYLRAGSTLAGAPLRDLENCAIPLEDVWGLEARRLWEELNTIQGEGARLALLESALVQRMALRRPAEPRMKVGEVAAWIQASEGRLSVERIAELAGFSRQHFARVFHASVGVSPKVYCEMARFRATLGYFQGFGRIDWAQVAAAAGYADQSHMIAEFRRFSGMTPEELRRGRWFHPFIERAGRSSRKALGPA